MRILRRCLGIRRIAPAVGLLACVALLPTESARAAKPGIPAISEKHLARLADGKIILAASREAGNEHKAKVTGMVEIAAEPSEIWSILLSLDHVKASAKAVEELTAYHDVTAPNGDREMRVRFKLRVVFDEVVYHVVRDYRHADSYMTWRLDDAKPNDVKWSVGSYSIHPGVTDPSKRLLLYSLEVDTGRNIPRWIEEELVESSLKKFLKYVKRTAEGE